MRQNSMPPRTDYSASLLVVIPARNEESTVGAVVGEVRETLGCNAAVVNDDSRDNTAGEAHAAGAKVLNLPWKLGAWGAMQAGIRYAAAKGYQYVVTIDADGQHSPADIPAVLESVAYGTADVSIGSCVDRGSPARRFAWSLFRSLTDLAFGDLTSGFRAYNRRAVELLASRKATLLDYQDVGVLLLLQRAGLKIVENPVSMRCRKEGHSRIFNTWSAVGAYMALTGVLSLSKGAGLRLLKKGKQRTLIP